MASMRLVLVEWVDSFGCSSNWEKLVEDSQPEIVTCKSVGWLFYDGTECKVVVPHISDPTENTSFQGCGDMTIPTKCISRIVNLYEVAEDPN